MGFFKNLRKAAMGQARPPVATAAVKVAPTADEREYAPMEVLSHRQHECIMVRSCDRFQDRLSAIAGDEVRVKLARIPKNDTFNNDGLGVYSLDGGLLGVVPKTQVDKIGVKPGERMAEVIRPKYRLETCIELCLPKLPHEVEAEQLKDALKLWTNLSADKWEGGDIGERADYFDGCSILVDTTPKGKPRFVIMGEGARLFTVNSRMKMYGDIEQRVNHKPRRIIVERKAGKNGQFYRVGLYF